MHTQVYKISLTNQYVVLVIKLRKWATIMVQPPAELKSEGPGLLPRRNSMPIANAEF